MPVATCFYSPSVEFLSITQLVENWAELAGLLPRHITFNTIQLSAQAGHPYSAVINLYLPALWQADDVKRIQLSLLAAVVENTGLGEADVFIMTSLISPGNVVDDGTIVDW